MATEGDRHTPFAAVYVLVVEEGRVLLLKRQNTGHRDGEYSLVAGHIDQGESATDAMVREANEEVGIHLQETDLEPVHVIHRNSGSRVYLDVFFEAHQWDGTVSNEEPEKCAELNWFHPNNLPDNTVPYVEQAIDEAHRSVFSEFGWN